MKRILGRQLQDDGFFDDFDKQSSRMMRSTMGWGIVMFLISAVLTVGVVVGCVWGVVKVLQMTGVL